MRDIPLACVGVISKVNILMLGFTLGISQGCQPIFSYNYGARQYSRVREAYRKAIVAASVICCIAFVCFQLFPRPIVALFDPSGSEEYFQFAERYFPHLYVYDTGQCLPAHYGQFLYLHWQGQAGRTDRPHPAGDLSHSPDFDLPLFLGIDGVMYAGPIADSAAVVVAPSPGYPGMKRMPHVDEPVAADTPV